MTFWAHDAPPDGSVSPLALRDSEGDRVGTPRRREPEGSHACPVGECLRSRADKIARSRRVSQRGDLRSDWLFYWDDRAAGRVDSAGTLP